MLVDTSTLLRNLQVHHPQYETATRALELLPDRGRNLCIVSQNLVELWVVATRPVKQNGLGMTPDEVAKELGRIQNMFKLLPDSRKVYGVWQTLVVRYQVSGKPAHDARLVAAMQVHGLGAVLTFDRTGFSRYAGIEACTPPTYPKPKRSASRYHQN